jgi:hypothetical protein
MKKAFLMMGLSITLTTSVLATVSSEGLMGHWTLDGNANDDSGNELHGENVGAVPIEGKFGQAYRFNGSAGIALGNLDFSNEKYTVSGWIRTTTPAIPSFWRNWLTKLDSSGGPQGGGPIHLAIGDGRDWTKDGPLYFVWHGGTTVVLISNETHNVRDGEWHMVTASYESGMQKLYHNGVLLSTTSFAGPLPQNSQNVIIGGSQFGAFHRPWIGDVDEVSIYNRVLTDAEVAELYTVNSNKAPDTTAAVANPATLWPPNNQMVPVNINGIIDPDGDLIKIEITGVSQDEPVARAKDSLLKKLSDRIKKSTVKSNKASSADAIINGETVLLRAERFGNGNGRVYRIDFRATDVKGSVSDGYVYVSVPHTQGTEAIAEVQKYDSTLR